MDRYRKIKIVGKGSFGYAVLVHHVSDKNKLYIMKIIDISKMEKKQRLEALNEVKVLKSMRHPYVITYRESFIEKSYLCIVMDYADGGDLYQKINEQKKKGESWPEDQVLDWFVQMALALKHVHDRKILHRDLKTQNIFLTSSKEVKMGDFGIARVLQHTYDCAKTAIGTPYYLSPEICQEKPYNHKSDVWSLGCILYEILTLNHAFDASSMKGLVLKILRGTYPPISNKYSEDMKNLVAELLQKDPEKRPSIKKVLEKEFLKKRINELLKNTLAKSDVTKQMQSGFITEPHRFDKEKENSARSDVQQPLTAKLSFMRKSSVGDNSSLIPNNCSSDRREVIEKLTHKPVSSQGVKLETNIAVTSPEDKKSSLPPSTKITSTLSSLLNCRSNSNQRIKSEQEINYQNDSKEHIFSKNTNSQSILNISNNSDKDGKKEGDKSNYFSSKFNSGHKSELNMQTECDTKEDSSLLADKNINYNSNGSNAGRPKSIKDSKERSESRDNEKVNYGELLISIDECLNKKKQENNFVKEEIIEDKPLKSNFMYGENDLTTVLGLSEQDTLGYKIEALRFYLEKQIGDKLFYNAYQKIQENADEEIYKCLLPGEAEKFVPFIFQLIVCEDSLYGQN